MDKNNKIILSILVVIAAFIILLAFILNVKSTDNENADATPQNETVAVAPPEAVDARNPEETVYTFFQGPTAWQSGLDWSGAWCNEYLRGQYFGSFGCGMCCIANIYDTFSPYEVNPLDIYYFARKNTGYSPSSKAGAISWGDMKVCLKKLGFSCDVYYKADSYEAFREQVKASKCMVAVVSSENKNSYWKKTPGHYITTWLYNDATQEVFIGDSGNPSNNRTWIPLQYVYDSLSDSDEFQYLLVSSYNENANEWKKTGMDPNVAWNAPDYYRPKQ